MAPADGGNGKSRWAPTGKDIGLVVMLLGGTVGSYKLIDASVEKEIRDNTLKIDATNKRLDHLEEKLADLQGDRLRDLRTVFERGSALQGAIDTLSRQLADVRQSMDGVERRTADTDRDIKQSLGELRGDVNHALRAPLPGPRR